MEIKTTNINYCWTVIEVKNLVELEWCDNVQWLPQFWNQAIVSKSVKVWDVWILFTTEVELSDEYCKMNNLYRHSYLNSNTEAKWYMEDNRRVKAMKFRWHTSSALFMPLESLSYINFDHSQLKVWDTFNEINWVEVCKKHVNKKNREFVWTPKQQRWYERINPKLIPEHLDSENYWRNENMLNDDDYITVTQKLHWTSVRLWNCQVTRPLKRWEKVINYFTKVDNTSWDTIWASRRVIKNWNIEEDNNHFYQNDVWKIVHDMYANTIPHWFVFYWEIVWRDNQTPIQKWYTYNLPEWKLELYIYRIAHVNDQWISSDVSFDWLMKMCNISWLQHVPVLYRWLKKDFNVDDYMNKVYSETFENAVALSDKNTVDEWVIVRREWISPLLLKAKAPAFFEYESKQLDTWEVDLETNES